MKDARRAAAEALIAVERGAYANLALKEILPAVAESNRPFCSALVYTALENQLYLDDIIARFAKGSMKPAAKAAIRLGLCQALLMDVPAPVAADESVKLIKAMGKPALAGFVNGVLRSAFRQTDALAMPSGMDARSMSIRRGVPEWVAERFISRFGAEAAEAVLACPGERGSLRANTLKAGVEQVRESLGFPVVSGRFVPEVLRFESAEGDLTAHPLFKSGAVALQSEASALVCKVADPKPNTRVLDACAAPGGKTACLAAMVNNKAEICAWDLHPHRVELIKSACSRLGALGVAAGEKDASLFDPAFAESFDTVLVDAPCSGLGVPGKPDLRLRKTEEDVTALAALQLRLLTVCSKYVRPGGVLVYSTCTISKTENEDVADAFLSSDPNFYPGDLVPYFPRDFDSSRLLGGRVQLLPPIDGVNGFFLARMLKK